MNTILKRFYYLLLPLLLLCYGCKTDTKPVIEITTNNMEIQIIDSIPSGWNTFSYKNQSQETHFIVFEKYPDGISAADTKADVFPVFDKGMTLINEGKTEEGLAAFGNLPPWFFNVVFTGGIGLTSPNTTSESTIYLEPGNYLMECYVKMPNGKFHSVMGMFKEIRVTNHKSAIEKPRPTIDLNISSANGITANTSYTKGQHTIAVTFTDQKAHEHFLGHDIHLVKLSNEANLEELNRWMNWTNPKGFISPSPKGVTFLGGIQEMPTGNTGYFSTNLTPGNYAFIAEVPSPKQKNMLKLFTVKQ